MKRKKDFLLDEAEKYTLLDAAEDVLNIQTFGQYKKIQKELKRRR